MRRPLVLAVVCAVGLVLVLVSQARLKKMVEETKVQETSDGLPGDLPPELRGPGGEKGEAVAPKNVEEAVPAGAPESEAVTPPKIDGSIEVSPSERETDPKKEAKEQVMSALLETRQAFQNREQVTEDVKANPHTTSSAITQAAGKLADLADLAAAHPEYQNDFNAFYLECAKDDKVITVTRVQCLEKYVQAKNLKGAEKKALLAQLPPAVTRLYSEIDRGP